MWTAPARGALKINVDASIPLASGVGLGFLPAREKEAKRRRGREGGGKRRREREAEVKRRPEREARETEREGGETPATEGEGKHQRRRGEGNAGDDDEVGGFKEEEDRMFGAWLRVSAPPKSRVGHGDGSTSPSQHLKADCGWSGRAPVNPEVWHEKVVEQTSVVQGGHETNVEQGLLISSSKLRDSTSDHAEASRIKMGGPTAVIGSPLPFRFTTKMVVMQNINPDPGAPISVSSEKRSHWKRRAWSSGAMICDNENLSRLGKRLGSNRVTRRFNLLRKGCYRVSE
ncbi:hypothetical protein ACOSQ4_017224 [Xanthoceras sorbifolium]